MPSDSHFLQMLVSFSIISSISENRPAEGISFMSVTKKELCSNLELMLLSFYLCSDHWIPEISSTSATIKHLIYICIFQDF